MIYSILILLLGLIHCKTSSTTNPNIALAALILNQNTNLPTNTTTTVVLREEFADTVVYAPNHNGDGFRDKTKAVNGVRGEGCCSGSTDVFSLAKTGESAILVLEWKDRKVKNGAGIDFVVFENPFQKGSSTSVFMEPAIVEVSLDGVNYCGFNPEYTFSPATIYSQNPSHWSRFAGLNPVYYNDVSNRLSSSEIFDPALAGGDGFDLDNLSSSNQFSIGCSDSLKNSIQTNGFLYLRITSATARINPNTGDFFVQDIGAMGGGPDIDGVAARYLEKR
jgi:hypothetical protein